MNPGVVYFFWILTSVIYLKIMFTLQQRERFEYVFFYSELFERSELRYVT